MTTDGSQHIVDTIRFLEGLIVQLEDNPDMGKMVPSIKEFGLLVPVVMGSEQKYTESLTPDQIQKLVRADQQNPEVKSIKELRAAQVEACKVAVAALRTLLKEWGMSHSTQFRS